MLLGITGEAKRKAIRSATEAAERATRWLWIGRADPLANAAGIQDPGWVTWVRLSDVKRPETPNDPRFHH